jgi:hypothetical protein
MRAFRRAITKHPRVATANKKEQEEDNNDGDNGHDGDDYDHGPQQL